jgi:hypothetical protein
MPVCLTGSQTEQFREGVSMSAHKRKILQVLENLHFSFQASLCKALVGC